MDRSVGVSLVFATFFLCPRWFESGGRVEGVNPLATFTGRDRPATIGLFCRRVLFVGLDPLGNGGKGGITDAGNRTESASEPGVGELARGLDPALMEDVRDAFGEELGDRVLWHQELAGKVVFVVGEGLTFAVDVPEGSTDAASYSRAGLSVASGLMTACDGTTPLAKVRIGGAENARRGVEQSLVNAVIATAAGVSGDLACGNFQGWIATAEGSNLLGVLEAARVENLGKPCHSGRGADAWHGLQEGEQISAGDGAFLGRPVARLNEVLCGDYGLANMEAVLLHLGDEFLDDEPNVCGQAVRANAGLVGNSALDKSLDQRSANV